MIGRHSASLLCLATLLGLAACGSENIQLASSLDGGAVVTDAARSAGDAGDAGDAADGGHVEAGRPCTSTSDCPQGSFCSKLTCDAPTGLCDKQDVASCPDDFQPVCGCDYETTYLNDCVRRAAGVSPSVTFQVACFNSSCSNPSSGCPSGDTCAAAFLLPPEAPAETCTRIPESALISICWAGCSTRGPAVWQRCNSSDASNEPCVDWCTAIRRGGLYHRGVCGP